MSALLEQLNEEMAAVVEKAKRSLVQVHNGGYGVGAGTIWHPDGLIVTNAHVADRHALRVTLADGRSLSARYLAHDHALDLAAIVVDAHDLPAIELGDSRTLRPGELVLALGHPLGVTAAVTAGVVIGVGAEWPRMPPLQQEWIAVDLPLRPGNSGGPLIDARGRLVGINTIMAGYHAGLAIPVHAAKLFLRQVLAPAGAAR